MVQIFACDEDPRAAAMHVRHRKHVVKMCLETAQLLYWAHWKVSNAAPGPNPYTLSKSHAHHPCLKWVCQSRGNYRWLVEHGIQLCHNYTAMYGKRHACLDRLELLAQHDLDVPVADRTPFAVAINDKELERVRVTASDGSLDTVATYRNYADPVEAEGRMQRNREVRLVKAKRSVLAGIAKRNKAKL